MAQIKQQLLEIKEGKSVEEDDHVADLDELDHEEVMKMLMENNVIPMPKLKLEHMLIPDEVECLNSVYLFHRDGAFRKTCYYIQQHRYFDRFIMVLIAFSSI